MPENDLPLTFIKHPMYITYHGALYKYVTNEIESADIIGIAKSDGSISWKQVDTTDKAKQEKARS